MRLLITLLLIAAASPALAVTPTISNVTGHGGTPASGQTWTIAGSSMVDEDKTNWPSDMQTGVKYGFEGATPTSYANYATYDASPEGWMCPSQNLASCLVHVTDEKLMGSKSGKSTVSGFSDGVTVFNVFGEYSFYDTGTGAAQDLYIRSYVKWDLLGGTWPTSHMKMIDSNYTTGDPGGQYYFQPGVAGGATPTSMGAKAVSESPAKVAFPDGLGLVENRWYCMEVYWASSTNTYQAWVDGVEIFNWNPVEDPALRWIAFGVVNASGTPSDFNLSNWYDGATVSSSRIYPASTIEIGNSATYGAGSEVYQPPVYLSDGSVQIETNLTGLGTGPYYVWVTNNRQERSLAYVVNTGDPIWYEDADGDNYHNDVTQQSASDPGPTWYLLSELTGGNDCNDTNIAINPGATEICNDSIDNNCDTLIDGQDTATCGSSPPTAGTTLLYEGFEDDNWVSRGWYDGTSSTGSTAGGQTGNALTWTWAPSATQPTGFSTIRQAFTATDEFLLDYWVKYDTGWQGSQQVYHPHLLMIQSTDDTAYQSLSRSNSNLYFESLADVGGSYTNYPRVAHQDMYRVNESYGVPPQDLTATTEDRSVGQCNTPYATQGADGGSCYHDGVGWYSTFYYNPQGVAIPANQWVHLQYHVKPNTSTAGVANSDGIFRSWVDGQLALDKTNVILAANAYAAAQYDKVILGPYIGDGSPIAQSMSIDELTISTVDNSPPSSPLPYDITVARDSTRTVMGYPESGVIADGTSLLTVPANIPAVSGGRLLADNTWSTVDANGDPLPGVSLHIGASGSNASTADDIANIPIPTELSATSGAIRFKYVPESTGVFAWPLNTFISWNDYFGVYLSATAVGVRSVVGGATISREVAYTHQTGVPVYVDVYWDGAEMGVRVGESIATLEAATFTTIAETRPINLASTMSIGSLNGGGLRVGPYELDNLNFYSSRDALVDTEPPTVTVTNPADGATGVAVNQTIAVTYSEAITCAAPVVTGVTTGSITCNSNVLTIPVSGQTTSTLYNVTVDGVFDTAATPNEQGAVHAFSYTTTVAGSSWRTSASGAFSNR